MGIFLTASRALPLSLGTMKMCCSGLGSLVCMAKARYITHSFQPSGPLIPFVCATAKWPLLLSSWLQEEGKLLETWLGIITKVKHLQLDDKRTYWKANTKGALGLHDYAQVICSNHMSENLIMTDIHILPNYSVYLSLSLLNSPLAANVVL